MIKEEDYLKAKQIVQEYEKQLNISDVISSVCEHERVDVPGKKLIKKFLTNVNQSTFAALCITFLRYI